LSSEPVFPDKSKIYANTFKPGIFDSDLPSGSTVFENIYLSNWNHFSAGITAWDLYRLNLHVNHSTPLSTGYQKLASDLNKDGNIDQEDVDLLNDLLLRKIESFPEFEHPWRFIPEFIPVEYETEFHSDPFDMLIQGNQVLNAEFTETTFEYSLTNTNIETIPGFRGIKLGKVG
jgi:hypothetical protein